MSDSKIADMLADVQHQALLKAIESLELYIHCASINSRYAVPGEADNVAEALEELYKLGYPDARI